MQVDPDDADVVPALTVAVVGAGPAGIYVADALLKTAQARVRVDLFDRLPTPFGLLRYGVAPDHLKMKTLQTTLQRTLDHPSVRFAGGVEVGVDVTVAQLRAAYHAVVYSFGASTDRRMAIPGEDLPGSASATEFVNWYSGHPDVAPDAFRLDMSTVVVVGVGNVAVDVARILLKDPAELASTDIPQPVLDVLAASAVTDVHVLGRRGPVQAKYTTKELAELGNLTGVDVLLDAADLALDPTSAAELAQAAKGVVANVNVLSDWAARLTAGAPRRLHLHFWCRPTALTGDGRVQAVTVERTRMGDDGVLRADGPTRQIEAGLVLRSVGYFGSAIAGVPVDAATGTIPNEAGRVLRDGKVSIGEYAAGWIGRGAVGVLGTNRRDANELVHTMADDVSTLASRPVDGEDVVARLAAAGHRVVDKTGWHRIDLAEQALGQSRDRERTKIASLDALFDAAAKLS